jgi:hypothetical protein
MTNLCTLPKEIIRYIYYALSYSLPFLSPFSFIFHSSSVLLKLPPSELTNKVNFINQQFHSQVTKEEFWKELCLVRYYIPSSGLKKPPNHTWKHHAFELGMRERERKRKKTKRDEGARRGRERERWRKKREAITLPHSFFSLSKKNEYRVALSYPIPFSSSYLSLFFPKKRE